MNEQFFTFNQLKEKYNWTTTEGTIEGQIRYARNRGVNIEFAFKAGKSYFKILNSIQATEWKDYPFNTNFEVNKEGLVRNKQTKKLYNRKDKDGYISLVDATSEPIKYYRAHRMVMETFNPIDNMENYIVDHINGKRDDNRLENLRWLTQRQNMNARDENYARLNENYQKLIQRYGYDGLNQLFESILNTIQTDC